MDAAHRFIVITGGPGSGKTSLIAALREKGCTTQPEAGRAVIRNEIRTGGSALPWMDREAFSAKMLDYDQHSYRMAEASSGYVFFDRGIPDILGYARLSHLTPSATLLKACAEQRYRNEVFIAPFWAEIFHNDAERRQDLYEAERTCDMMQSVYSGLGYSVVPLPKASLAERVHCILHRLHGAV